LVFFSWFTGERPNWTLTLESTYIHIYMWSFFFFFKECEVLSDGKNFFFEGNCFIVNISKIWIYFTQNICYYNYVESVFDNRRVTSSTPIDTIFFQHIQLKFVIASDRSGPSFKTMVYYSLCFEVSIILIKKKVVSKWMLFRLFNIR